MRGIAKRMRRRRMVIALGVVLGLVLVADLMRLVKPSGLSAAACVPTLFRNAADESQFIDAARSEIVRESEAYDLPPLLVAAVAVDHLRQLSSYRAFTDCFGSALGHDLSLGPAQIRMSTAAQLDGQSFSNLSATAHRRLRIKLLNPMSNISYETRELRALLERSHRAPGISATELLNSPATMALLITEYRSGRMSTAEESSPVGANALRTLRLLQDEALVQFRDPGFEVARSQADIETYFSEIRCRKGKSNRACARDSQEAPPAGSVDVPSTDGAT